MFHILQNTSESHTKQSTKLECTMTLIESLIYLLVVLDHKSLDYLMSSLYWLERYSAMKGVSKQKLNNINMNMSGQKH